MDKQLWLHRVIMEELARCEKLYDQFQEMLLHLPRGSLLDRNGHTYRAYRENNIQYQKPIKRNTQLVEDMKMRQFLKKGLPLLQKRIEACRAFLQRERFYDPLKIEGEMKKIYSGVSDLPVYLEGDLSESMWKNQNAQRNGYPFEEDHFTAGGEQVRSKSEAMIGTEMEHRNMIFICEPPLWLEDKVVYPDFAVFLPGIRRCVYLEHFGRMDEPGYLKKAMFKLMHYHNCGLYLGINFFFTWETKDHPLNTKEINVVLDKIQSLDK